MTSPPLKRRNPAVSVRRVQSERHCFEPLTISGRVTRVTLGHLDRHGKCPPIRHHQHAPVTALIPPAVPRSRVPQRSHSFLTNRFFRKSSVRDDGGDSVFSDSSLPYVLAAPPILVGSTVATAQEDLLMANDRLAAFFAQETFPHQPKSILSSPDSPVYESLTSYLSETAEKKKPEEVLKTSDTLSAADPPKETSPFSSDSGINKDETHLPDQNPPIPRPVRQLSQKDEKKKEYNIRRRAEETECSRDAKPLSRKGSDRCQSNLDSRQKVNAAMKEDKSGKTHSTFDQPDLSKRKSSNLITSSSSLAGAKSQQTFIVGNKKYPTYNHSLSSRPQNLQEAIYQDILSIESPHHRKNQTTDRKFISSIEDKYHANKISCASFVRKRGRLPLRKTTRTRSSSVVDMRGNRSLKTDSMQRAPSLPSLNNNVRTVNSSCQTSDSLLFVKSTAKISKPKVADKSTQASFDYFPNDSINLLYKGKNETLEEKNLLEESLRHKSTPDSESNNTMAKSQLSLSFGTGGCVVNSGKSGHDTCSSTETRMIDHSSNSDSHEDIPTLVVDFSEEDSCCSSCDSCCCSLDDCNNINYVCSLGCSCDLGDACSSVMEICSLLTTNPDSFVYVYEADTKHRENSWTLDLEDSYVDYRSPGVIVVKEATSSGRGSCGSDLSFYTGSSVSFVEPNFQPQRVKIGSRGQVRFDYSCSWNHLDDMVRTTQLPLDCLY